MLHLLMGLYGCAAVHGRVKREGTMSIPVHGPPRNPAQNPAVLLGELMPPCQKPVNGFLPRLGLFHGLL
jgi:hypothetical protein